jgi:hypothetical protein
MSFNQNNFSTIRCMIKHILEAQFSESELMLYTIFGKTKNVFLIGTVLDKREEIYQKEGEDKQRIVFEIDDGTGVINAVKWDEKFERYKDIKKGDIIELQGSIPKRWKEFNSLSLNFLRRVENPNLELLRYAEIIKKIKIGDVEEIPDLLNQSTEIDEIYVEGAISEENQIKNDEMKESIFKLVENYSKNGKGLSIEEILTHIRIQENDLRNYLRDLEMESRIYQSDDNIYQSYY